MLLLKLLFWNKKARPVSVVEWPPLKKLFGESRLNKPDCVTLDSFELELRNRFLSVSTYGDLEIVSFPRPSY